MLKKLMAMVALLNALAQLVRPLPKNWRDEDEVRDWLRRLAASTGSPALIGLVDDNVLWGWLWSMIRGRTTDVVYAEGYEGTVIAAAEPYGLDLNKLKKIAELILMLVSLFADDEED